MTKQNFLDISKKSEVNSKFILILVIIAFIVVGGLFAYEYWWRGKEISSEIEEKKTSEVKILEIPNWGWKKIEVTK